MKEDIHFYKSLPYIFSLDIKLNYPMFVSDPNDPGEMDLALIGRDNDKWFLFSNNPYGDKRMVGISDHSLYLENNRNGIANNSMVEQFTPTQLDKYLTQFANLKGTILQHESILKPQGFTLFIETIEAQRSNVEELIIQMKDILNITYSIQEIKQGKSDIPICIKHLKDSKQFNELELIKTVWKMRRRELVNNVAGIFQNKGFFRPKYFDSTSANLIANIYEDKIKGSSNYIDFGNFNDERIVEFEVLSYWFGDFFRNVIKRYMGSFYYWSYSQGNGYLENYFIINGEMKNYFLSGLLSHWKESARLNHHNSIEYIKKLNELI